MASTEEQPDAAAEPDPTPASPPAAAPAPAKKKRSSTRGALEWVAVIGGALVLALVIRTFLLAAFYIPSGSMLDTLHLGDRVLVNKLSYQLHGVNRGDVIVFDRPPGQPESGIKDLIKRVIATGGETVEGRGCKLYITPAGATETFVLDEPYLARGWTRGCDFGPVTLEPGTLWVMGDNRDDSEDSRYFGPISESLVVGRAFVIVWPFTHIGWL